MAEHTFTVHNGKAVGSQFYNFGGYYYHLERENISSLNFVCKHSHCPGRAIMSTNSEFRVSSQHNHAPDLLYSEVHSVRAAIVNEARSMSFTPFGDIIRTARRRISNEMVRSQLTLRSLRGAMQRARYDVFPPIPRTLFGVSRILEDPVWETLTRSVDFQDRIYLGTAIGADVSVNIIFMSSRGLQLLRETVRVFADGTFYISPSVEGCYQVFTLVIISGHTVIPICWSLMQNKSQEAYMAVLSLIRDHLGTWNFRTVLCDFEDAIMVSFRIVFDVDVQGCLFHASKAMTRYAKDIYGLHLIHSYPEVQLVIWLCCSLPLLPMNLLQRGLNAIGLASMALGDFLYGIIRVFLEYMQSSWLEHPNRGSSMSVCGSEHRTNNGSESNNYQMQKKIKVHHPNVFHFVRNVAEFEQDAHDDILSLQRGIIPSRNRGVVSVANDEFIIRITNVLLSDPDPSDQTLIDFLFSASASIQGLLQDALN